MLLLAQTRNTIGFHDPVSITMPIRTFFSRVLYTDTRSLEPLASRGRRIHTYSLMGAPTRPPRLRHVRGGDSAPPHLPTASGLHIYFMFNKNPSKKC